MWRQTSPTCCCRCCAPGSRSSVAAQAPERSSIGVTWEDVHRDQGAAIEQIVVRYRALAHDCDAALVVGTDFTDVGASGEFSFNARLAANLGLPVLCVVSGAKRSEKEIIAAIEHSLESLRDADCDVEAMFANRIEPDLVADIAARMDQHDPPVYVFPEDDLLAAPTVADLLHACGGELIGGDPSALGLEVRAFVVASMMLPNLLDRLSEGAIVITAGDRADVILTGNNTYKAVQRSASGVAIGPVLQGLRKPVNDLSRGALLQDIVNTVAITAIQAQDQRSQRGSGELIGAVQDRVEAV